MDAVDSDWKKIQVKAFTNWFNDRLRGNLREAPIKVNDITVDLCDGVLLCQAVMGLLRKKGLLTKQFRYNKVPRLYQHKLENLGIVLATLKEQKIKLVNIGPEDLMSGNLKLWLGLIWTLIDEFQIKSGKGVSSKKALLDWLNAVLPPEMAATNFTTDWNDGRRLCTLVDTLRPGVCPHHASLNPTAGLQNCDLGMSLAQQHLNVPMLLDPGDLNNPIVDQLSVMTYLSYFIDSQTESLLRWLQERLPDQDIANLTTDWNNGILLSALVDSFSPGILPHHKSLSATKALDNVTMAMKIAKQRLGVSDAGVKASEVTNPKLDNLVMAAYLTEYKKCTLQASPGQCLASGPGIKVARLNLAAKFNVDCTQGGSGELSVTAKGPRTQAKVKTDGHGGKKGSYDVSYEPLELGNFTVTVEFNKESIPGSPFTVPCVDPANCHVKGSSLGGQGGMVGKPLEFEVDMRTAGPGTVEPSLFGPSGIQPVKVTTSADGVVALTSTPNIPGNYSLDLKLSGLTIPGSPYAIAVSDPSKCRLLTSFQSGHLGKVGTPIEIAVDTSKAGPGVLTAVATSASRTVCLQAQGGEANVSTIAFVPSEAGEHAIDVLWDGHSVPGCPLRVPVIDVSLCCFEAVPSYAQVAKPLRLRLLAQQSISAALHVQAQNEAGSIVPATVQRSGDGGAYIIALVPTQVGTLEIDATWSGEQVSQCPFDVQVCDASRCSAYGPGLTEAAKVGDPVNFTVQAKDAGNGTLSVKPCGPKAVYSASVQSNGDGTYDVTFTPWEKGPHQIAIEWGNEPIKNSPLPLAVTGRVRAAQITASGNGLKEATALSPAEFVVQSKTPIDLLEGEILRVTVRSGNEDAAVDVADLGEGRCSVTYVAPCPGSYTVGVVFAGEHIAGSPFSVDVAARPDASRCVVSGNCLSPGAKPLAGDPLDFTVATANAGSGRLKVAAKDGRGAACRVFMATDSDDVYSVRVDTREPGKYSVSVQWAGSDVPGSPFAVATSNRITAQSMHVEGPGLKSGRTGEEASFTIHAPKAGLMDAGELTVQVANATSGELQDVKTLDGEDGRYNVTYRPLVAEEHTIAVRYIGQNLPGSPFCAVITARPMATQCVTKGDCLDKAKLNVVGEPMEFEINTSSAGNGRLVVKAEGPGGEVLRAFQSDEGGGVYSIRLDPTAGTGMYVVNCLWSGDLIPGSPFQLAVGDKLTAQMVSASGEGLREVYAMREATFVVAAKKPELFDDGSLKMTVVGDSGHLGLAVADNSDGTYTVTYMAPTDGQYAISVFLSGEDIPGSPFHVTAYLPPKADRCMARGHCLEPDGKMMVGKSAEFTVNTADAGHGKLTVKASDPEGRAMRTFLSDDGEGVHTLRIDPKVTGEYGVDVRWSGEHIPGSPFKLSATDGLSPGTITASGTGLSRAFSLMPTAFMLDTPEAGLLERGDLTVTIDSALRGKAAEVELHDQGDGMYTVSYMAPSTGAFLASVKYRGVHVPGSPFKITVFPRPSPNKCRAFGKCLEAKARNICSKPLEFKVATKDAGYGRLGVKALDPQGLPTPAFIAEEAKDLYMVRIDAKRPGKYMVNIKWGNIPIGGSPFKIRTHPATDASKVLAEGPGLRSGGVTIGRETSFVMRTHEAGNGSLVVRIHGVKEYKDSFNIQVDKDAHDPRLLHAKYTPKEAGDYEVTILWSDVHIPGSPFQVPIVDPHARQRERAPRQPAAAPKKRLVKVTKTQGGMTYRDDSGQLVHTDDPAVVARLEQERVEAEAAAMHAQQQQPTVTRKTVEERRVRRVSRKLDEAGVEEEEEVVVGGGLPPAKRRSDSTPPPDTAAAARAVSPKRAAAAAQVKAKSPPRGSAAAAAAEPRGAPRVTGQAAQPQHGKARKPSRSSFTEDDISPEFDNVFAAQSHTVTQPHRVFKKSSSTSSVEPSSKAGAGKKSKGKKLGRKQSEPMLNAQPQRAASISTKARGAGFLLDPSGESRRMFTGELRGARPYRLEYT